MVVCPVCGAPHHRDCYRQNGGCALESQHHLGKEWQPPQSAGTQSAPGAVCPVCGSPAVPGAQYCPRCGTPLAAPNNPEQPPRSAGQDFNPSGQPWGSPWNAPGQGNNPQNPWGSQQNGAPFGGADPNANPNGGWRGQADPRQGGWNGPQGGPGGPFPYSRYAPPFAGIDMNEEIDGISVKEYAAMVGPNAPYYITRFKAMASRRVVSWNWGAFFFNFLYFFYRKMYAIGALLAVLFVTSLLPTFLFTWEYLQELVASGAAMSFPLPQIYTPHMDQLMLMQSFLRTLWFVVMILCGLWANRLYFSAVKNTILKIRQDPRSQDVSFYIRALSAQGGISKGAVLLVVGILFLAYMTFSYVVGMTILG